MLSLTMIDMDRCADEHREPERAPDGGASTAMAGQNLLLAADQSRMRGVLDVRANCLPGRGA